MLKTIRYICENPMFVYVVIYEDYEGTKLISPIVTMQLTTENGSNSD